MSNFKFGVWSFWLLVLVSVFGFGFGLGFGLRLRFEILFRFQIIGFKMYGQNTGFSVWGPGFRVQGT